MLTHLNPAPVAPRRTVILGASGFIASQLASALSRNRGAVRTVPSKEIDLRQPDAGDKLAGILKPDDAVVMTSALTPEKGRDNATLMQNLRMAESVGAALAKQPVSHLVYLSSDAVYDWRTSLISEDTVPSPTDLYSTMHLARERMLAVATASADVPLCIVRPCAIYGDGDTHNGYGPNRFVRSARTDGIIKLFGAGEEKRDHIAIDDVVRLLAKVLSHRSSGTLNAVTGTSISFADLAREVAAVVGKHVAIEHMPRSGAITHRHFNPAALFRAFPDHEPTRIRAGLRKVTLR